MVKHETPKCGYHFKQITKPILRGAMGSSLSQVQFCAVATDESFGGKVMPSWKSLFKQGMSGVVGSCLKNEDLWQHPTTDFHLRLELVRYRARPIQAPDHLQVQGTQRREVTSTSKRLDCNLQLGWKKGLRKSIASILSIWFFSCVVRFLHVPNCVAHLTIRRFYSKTSFISTNQPISETTFSGRVSSDTRSPKGQ